MQSIRNYNFANYCNCGQCDNAELIDNADVRPSQTNYGLAKAANEREIPLCGVMIKLNSLLKVVFNKQVLVNI